MKTKGVLTRWAVLLSGLCLLPLAGWGQAVPTPVPKAQELLQERAKSKEPVYISADKVSYNGTDKTNTWTGHVVVRQGSSRMVSDRLVGTSAKDSATAQGHVCLTDDSQAMQLISDELEYRNNMKVVVATGHPEFTRQDKKAGELCIRGDSIELQDREKKALAKGNVWIIRQDIKTNSEQAFYSDTEQTMQLTGSPEVIKGRNIFQGETITAYLKDDRIVLQGRVKATFYSADFANSNF